NVINSKLPGPFIEQHEQVLANARTLVASEPGMAYALAWNLRRSDIHLYDDRGELTYGLGYADAPPDKAISKHMLPQWLGKARKKGNVAVFLRLPHDSQQIKARLQPFPPGYELYHHGHYAMLVYN